MENGLSFIETSALDASNVEMAFQKIQTGNIKISPWILFFFLIEIYRIVANKALESQNNASGPGKGETITVQPTDSPAVCK